MIRLNKKKAKESQKGARIVFMSGHGYVKVSFFRFIIQNWKYRDLWIFYKS